jgi:hypothetical protein
MRAEQIKRYLYTGILHALIAWTEGFGGQQSWGKPFSLDMGGSQEKTHGTHPFIE